eukprot:3293980-Prymnesium_polylepis.1
MYGTAPATARAGGHHVRQRAATKTKLAAARTLAVDGKTKLAVRRARSRLTAPCRTRMSRRASGATRAMHDAVDASDAI